MTLRHLNVFICVCDEGNMTAAAQKLHIAQPSISQAIAELEGYYNVKLFETIGAEALSYDGRTEAGNLCETHS